MLYKCIYLNLAPFFSIHYSMINTLYCIVFEGSRLNSPKMENSTEFPRFPVIKPSYADAILVMSVCMMRIIFF